MDLTSNSTLDPIPQRLLSHPEIRGDLLDRPAARSHQLDGLTTELLRARGTAARHTHHIFPAGPDGPKRSDVHETGGTPPRWSPVHFQARPFPIPLPAASTASASPDQRPQCGLLKPEATSALAFASYSCEAFL